MRGFFTSPSLPKCKLEGCSKLVFSDSRGKHEFCSKTHAAQWKQQEDALHAVQSQTASGAPGPFQGPAKILRGQGSVPPPPRMPLPQSAEWQVAMSPTGIYYWWNTWSLMTQWWPPADLTAKPAATEVRMPFPQLPIRTLYFYEKEEPFYEFTNFAEGFPFFAEGVWWPTSEHYFQAQKFHTIPPVMELIRTQPSPRAAFDLARALDHSKRPDWESAKTMIMADALRFKFSQNRSLKSLLLYTNPLFLVEASPIDGFWGYGPDKNGLNKLGSCLMYLRELMLGGGEPLVIDANAAQFGVSLSAPVIPPVQNTHQIQHISSPMQMDPPESINPPPCEQSYANPATGSQEHQDSAPPQYSEAVAQNQATSNIQQGEGFVPQ